MPFNLYTYRATITSVYDGDTCTMDIDLGLNTWVRNEKLRLNRINTPELKGENREAGLRARDRLRELVLNKNIILQTVTDKKGKYGRYLGELWIINEAGQFLNINDLLVKEDHAQYFMTESNKPLPTPA